VESWELAEEGTGEVRLSKRWTDGNKSDFDSTRFENHRRSINNMSVGAENRLEDGDQTERNGRGRKNNGTVRYSWLNKKENEDDQWQRGEENDRTKPGLVLINCVCKVKNNQI